MQTENPTEVKELNDNDVREVIVIGGAAAGYTAALYAARANMSPLVIEGVNWGGQLMITSDVENYPGYSGGVLGPEMMQDFRKQAERFGAEFLTDDVTKVDFSERPFRVWVGDDEYRAESVIVATGANARQLGLPSERTLQGRGVSYCAVCDAAFFRDKDVVVVGGGDSAMEEATFLAKFASKVIVVHRRDVFRASPIMVDRARATEKIEFVVDSVVEEVIGGDVVTGVVVSNVKTGERTEIPADALFVAIGHDPTTELFKGQLDMDPASGYLITKGSGARVLTSVPKHIAFITKRKEAHPDDFAQVVRLVKWWVKQLKEADSSFRFKSFMVELLVAHLADTGKIALSDYVSALEDFFDYVVLTGLKERISFTDNYSPSKLPAASGAPIEIFDPVNPDNNVAARYTDTNRRAIVEAAAEAADHIAEARFSDTKGRATTLWQAVMGRSFSFS